MTNFQNVHSCLLVYFPTKPRGVGQKELCQHILQCYLGRSGLLFCGFVICECKTEKNMFIGLVIDVLVKMFLSHVTCMVS